MREGWSFTNDGRERFSKEGVVLVEYPLDMGRPTDPQVLVEADLLTGVRRLSLYAQGEWDPSGRCDADKELSLLLRLVQPYHLVIWRDWWEQAQTHPSVHLLPLPERAMAYGLRLAWRARSAAQRVLTLSDARTAIREADLARVDAQTVFAEARRYE